MTSKDKTVRKRRGMRKPIPNPSEQRKKFLALGMYLKAGEPLTKAQREYLADRFVRIGNGRAPTPCFISSVGQAKVRMMNYAAKKLA